MRILVAEDNDLSLRLLRNCLGAEGYELSAVQDGTSAWEHVEPPDGPRIALLDNMMPELTGTEICRRLRALEAAQPDRPRTYVIVVTCLMGKDDMVELLDAGADDCLTKPYHAGELRARVRAAARIVRYQESLRSKVLALSQRGEEPANREPVAEPLAAASPAVLACV